MFSAVGIALGKMVTETFMSNTPWVAPAGVSNIPTMSGKGQDGTPSSYSGNTPRSASMDTVIVNAGSGGSSSGGYSWSDFTDAATAVSTINAGGSGTVYGVYYQGYAGDNTYNIGLVTASYSNAVVGSAVAHYNNGWQFSGSLPPNVSTSSYVTWDEQGETIPASNGADTTGFGKTFPGGIAGGAASVTNFTNVAVTPGSTYNLVIPPGGSITITYYKP